MSGKIIHNLKRARLVGPTAAAALFAASEPASEPLNLVVNETKDFPAAPPVCRISNRDSFETVQQAKRQRIDNETETPDRSAPQPTVEVAPSDFLKAALQKVLALQADLARIDAEATSDDNENDDVDSGNEEEDTAFLGQEAEALGFAICARETLTFLAANGQPADGLLVQRMRERLLGKCAGLPI